jgi:predicted nucleic acid-binding protein
MILYAESSAVLAWLLDELSAPVALRALTEAEQVFASDLTLVECKRVLIRSVALGELSEVEAADRRAQLVTAADQWNMIHVTTDIVDRASQPFHGQPIRTLDAIHLASVLVLRGALQGIRLLTFDDRIRKSAGLMGLDLIPD